MSFLSLLINKCDIVKETVNEWGESSTSYITDQDCRIEWKNKWVRNMAGEKVLSGALVFMKPDADIEVPDRLKLDGREREVILISKLQDSTGVHHLEVSVK